MSVQLHHGDCLIILPTLPPNSIDAVVTDSPYHLTQVSRNGSPRQNDLATPFGRTRLGSAGFMNETWDGGDISMRPETWRLVYDVLKPGGHLLAFSSTRTYHRMTCAIEDAGFEIRDQIGFVHATGMPKSRDVYKDIAKRIGAEAAEPYRGIGSCLKPAWEPVAVCRKPLIGNLADNVIEFGTGGINIDPCRIPIDATVDDSRLGGKGEHANKTPHQECLWMNY
jgi:site-specific DNA-methyltransferase (adenine-specific)